MSSAGGGGDIGVTISGDAGGLQSAVGAGQSSVAQLGNSFAQLATAAASVTGAMQSLASGLANLQSAQAASASAAQQNASAQQQNATAHQQEVAAIAGTIAAYNNETAALNYVQNATQVLGSAQAQAGVAWAQAATSADDYRQRLQLLQAELQYMQASLGDTGKQTDQMTVSWGNLQQGVLNSLGPFGQWLVLAGSVVELASPFINAFEGAADSVLHLAEALGNDVVQAAQAAAQEIENLTQQVFDLSNTTEQNTGAWRFLYGGAQNAQSLMEWTSQFSMKIPYTRQDLMQAITALGRMGLSEQTVEQYMPTIADMGTLNPQRSLMQAAWAIQGASAGRSMQLRYDYGISPQDLEKYGLQISGIGHIDNPDQLLPALQRYLAARGLTGSAEWAATNTWWGAWSSFVDRIQNFGLQVGGTNLSGTVQQGSMFGTLKADLADISKWIDTHGDQIAHLADLFSTILGSAARDATAALGGLANALGQTGIADFLFGSEHTDKKTGQKQMSGGLLGNLGAFLSSQDVKNTLTEIGQVLADVIAPAMKDLATAGQDFINALGGTGVGSDILEKLTEVGMWLGSPSTQAGIQELATAFGTLAGQGIQGAINAVQSLLQGLGNIGAPSAFLTDLKGLVQWFSDPDHQHAIELTAYVIGTDLGGMFELAADSVKNLFDAISALGTELGDLSQIIVDVTERNYAKAAADAQTFLNDVKNNTQTLVGDITTWWGDYFKVLGNVTNPQLPGGGGPGTPSNTIGPPPGSPAWKVHMQHAQGMGDQLGDAVVHAMSTRLSQASTGDELASAIAGSISRQLGKGSAASLAAQNLGGMIGELIAQAIAAELGQQAFNTYLTTRQPGSSGLTTITYGIR